LIQPLWYLFVILIAIIIAYAGTLKVLFGSTQLPLARWLGAAELVASALLIVLPATTSAYLASAVFLGYAVGYAVVVKRLGHCNCLNTGTEEDTPPPRHILAGVLRRLAAALVAYSFGALLLPVERGSSLALSLSGLLVFPLLGGVAAVAVSRRNLAKDYERAFSHAVEQGDGTHPDAHVHSDPGTTQPIEHDRSLSLLERGMSRRTLFQGASALVLGLAVAIGFPTAAHAHDSCAIHRSYCLACCDDYCPHGDCWAACDSCRDDCNGWHYNHCTHPYSCWENH
jgi:hypothetical protein